MRILNLGKGYLTYAMAGLAIIYGVIGYIFGWLDNPTALKIIWIGLTAFGVRRAIK